MPAFNLHEQIEALRASGRFGRTRDLIRHHDEQLQGSLHPVVADHGFGSETWQYARRVVSPDWVAPLESASPVRDQDDRPV